MTPGSSSRKRAVAGPCRIQGRAPGGEFSRSSNSCFQVLEEQVWLPHMERVPLHRRGLCAAAFLQSRWPPLPVGSSNPAAFPEGMRSLAPGSGESQFSRSSVPFSSFFTTPTVLPHAIRRTSPRPRAPGSPCLHDLPAARTRLPFQVYTCSGRRFRRTSPCRCPREPPEGRSLFSCCRSWGSSSFRFFRSS